MKRNPSLYSFPRLVGIATDPELVKLDLSATDLFSPFRAAEYARRDAGLNPLMPSAASGAFGNFAAIEEFRRSVGSTHNPAPGQPGWSHTRGDILRRTFNVNLGISVIIASGDEYTGHDLIQDPHTVGPKGPNVMRHILRNRAALGYLPFRQGDLLSGEGEEVSAAAASIMALPLLYILMIATEERGGGMELSLPLGMECGVTAGSLGKGMKSKVVHFGPRLIIKPSSLFTIPAASPKPKPKPIAKPVVKQSGEIDFDL